MYPIMFFALSIILLAGFLILKKYYSKKDFFLLNSIEQLTMEKKVLANELKEKNEVLNLREKELAESHKSILDLTEKIERSEKENEALRNLMDALQKKQDSKNEDIVVEYFIKD